MPFIRKSLATWLLISGLSAFAHEPQASTAINITEITNDPSCVFELSDNPFANYDSGPFPYDQLRVEHFEPAFENGLAIAKRRLAQLQRDPSKPLFANTVEEIEKLTEPFQRVLSILDIYSKVKSSPEMLSVKARIMAKAEAFNLDVWSDPYLQARVKAVKDLGPLLRLTPEENTLLDKTLDQMISLEPEQLTRLKEINARIEKLRIVFQANMSKEIEAFKLFIENKNDLGEMAPNLVASAAKLAADLGRPGLWAFGLDRSTYTDFMASVTNRDLREKMWRAIWTIGIKGETDNHPIVEEMLRLRQEGAILLKYKNHAAWQLRDRMAKNVESVNQFLKKLADAYRIAGKAEIEELKKIAGHEIAAWDVRFYEEEIKRQKFSIKDTELRPYFAFENVLKGAFFAANQLFGVEFVERPEMPKWDPSVRTFEVLDRTKKHLAYYYFDPFLRKGKRDGAFMNELIKGGSFRWGSQRPHVVNVASLTPPADGELALLSLANVITIFHEMGHGLHSVLSQTKYTSQFGPAVAWDAVELPSKLFEKFAFAPEVLDVYARHYKNPDEKLPVDLIEKIKASRNVGAALEGLYHVYKSKLDMILHTEGLAGRTMEQIEASLKSQYYLIPEPGAVYSTSYRHIFASEYSAGFYSYDWSDVLASDVDEMFQENGRFDPATAGLLQLHIMEAGSSEPADVLFRRLRGRDPDPDALFRAQGILPTNQSKQLDLFYP